MSSTPLIGSETDVTPAVLDAMAAAPDARLRAVMESAVRHLHAFLLETRPSEEEFEAALRWIAALGHHTDEANNEVVLAADVLGASTLIDLINNDGMQGETMSALLGPFYRGAAPECANGESIARSPTPGAQLHFSGRVTDVDGRPIVGAKLDVWQASPAGFYENQDPEQADFNLRGVFHTDGEGRFAFRSVRPAGYPVPTGGPVGALLRAQRRRPMRPAHIHFIVSAKGHKTLVTQIFCDEPAALADDVVFGAKQQIAADFVPHHAASALHPGMEPPFFTCEYDFVLKPGPSTYPMPPISGKRS